MSTLWKVLPHFVLSKQVVWCGKKKGRKPSGQKHDRFCELSLKPNAPFHETFLLILLSFEQYLGIQTGFQKPRLLKFVLTPNIRNTVDNMRGFSMTLIWSSQWSLPKGILQKFLISGSLSKKTLSSSCGLASQSNRGYRISSKSVLSTLPACRASLVLLESVYALKPSTITW